MDFAIFQQLGVAFVLATLVGLEREKKYQLHKENSFGGIRTFALIGILGALSSMLMTFSVVLSGILTAGFLALVVVSYWAIVKKTGQVGATSEIAAILVFVIGIYSAMGEFVLATVLALAISAVLHFKVALHAWAKHLRNEELISTLEFIVVAFVVLPLLPNAYFGPFEFFNPYIVWLMVVFVSGISFGSYILIKFMGPKKGIGMTGFLAGLISSTALALSFSAQSKKSKSIVNPYVVAIIVASTAMFFRILVEVAVLNKELLGLLAIPMVTMGAIGIVGALFFWFKKEKLPAKATAEALDVKSPFSLGPALKFGAFFAVILFLTKYAGEFYGDKGVYITSVVSGVLDVDAITVSVANLAKNGLSDMSAVIAITIAAITNTLVKGGIFLAFGNRKVALRIMAVFVLMVIGGAASLTFIF